MKRILIFIFLLLTSNLLFSQSDERVEELKTVITKFFETYHVTFPAISNVRFIKKPDLIFHLRYFLSIF